MIALLTLFAPLIIQGGMTLINIFVTDQAAKLSAQSAFLAAIQAHLNDAVSSVNNVISYQAQIDALKKQADNPPPPAAS